MNDFTIQEAIEIAIKIRDKLPLPETNDIKHNWREKDALALLINFAELKLNESVNENV